MKFFETTRHKIYERDHFNGIIETKTIIYKNPKIINGVRVPIWSLVIYVLLILALLAVLGAAIYLTFFSRRPGLFNEDCIQRSCFKSSNLKCINNTCQCLESEYYLSKCEKKKSYMESCSRSFQCENKNGLVCYNGKCTCEKSSFWNNYRCANKYTYEEFCSSSQQCLETKMLNCSEDGICVCNSDRFWDEHVCLTKRSLNEKCLGPTACNEKKGLICVNGYCSCDPYEAYYDNLRNTCMKYLKYSEYDCDINNCLPNKGLICNMNSLNNTCDCPVQSNNSMCDCLRINGTVHQYYWSSLNQSCIQARNENQNCINSYECFSTMICNSSLQLCQCPTNFFFNLSSYACEPKTLNNTYCSSSNTCRTDLGLTCQSSFCSCNTNTHFWYDNFMGCIAYLNYSETICSSDSECIPNSGLFCNLNTSTSSCNCPSSTKQGMCDCYKEIGYGWREYFWNSSACVLAKDEGDPCSISYECLYPMYCDSSLNTCQCNKFYYFDSANHSCLPQTFSNSTCSADRTCRIDLGLTCQGGYCNCNSTQFWFDNSTGCINYLMYNENGCLSENDCAPNKNLICYLDYDHNECNCPAKSTYGMCDCIRLSGINETFWNTSTSQCQPAKTYNAPCSNTYECLDVLVCSISGVCICNSSLSYFNSSINDCTPKTLNNTSCSDSSTCRTDLGLACISNLCQCNDSSTKWFSSKIGCASLLKYSQVGCLSASDCVSGKGLVCALSATTNQCNCPSFSKNSMCDCARTSGSNQFYWNSTQCVQALSEYAPCTSTYQCFNGMTCNLTTNKCMCPFTYYFNTSSYTCEPQTLNYTSCSLNSTCRSDLGLYCKSSYCQCNSATQFWYNNTIGCRNYLTYGEKTCTADWQCAPGSNLICNLNPIINLCDCPTKSETGMCDCVRQYETSCSSKTTNEFYWDSSKSQCVAAIEDKKTCAFNYQCIRPLQCNSDSECGKPQLNQGICVSGWYYYLGKCYKFIDKLLYNQLITQCLNENSLKKTKAVVITNMAELNWLNSWKDHIYTGNYTCCSENKLPATYSFGLSEYPLIDKGCIKEHDNHDHGGFCEYTP